MRYCVNGRQPHSVLKRADEIKIDYKDKALLIDFAEKYSEKTILLDLATASSTEEIFKDMKTLSAYREKFSEFYVGIRSLKDFIHFYNSGIKWYWPFPITTYYELNHIIKLGASYVLLGPPLCFDLEKVKDVLYSNVKIRLIVNNAVPDYLVNLSGFEIYGPWIRPEDVKQYEQYVDCLEFDVPYGDYKKEETLLDIYQKGEWPGNLSLLFKNFGYNVDNRAIPEELGEVRMNCGQGCLKDRSCRLCYNALVLAQKLRKMKYDSDKNA